MRGAHDRHEVDVDALGPARLVVARAETRRIVDQDVDAAERLRCRRDVGGNGVLVGEIAYASMRLDAVRQDLVHRRVECGLAPGANRNGGAGSREREGNRPPDTPAAAGDYGALTFQANLH